MPKAILLADDFVEYTTMLLPSLKAAGYDVLVVNEGEKAVAAAKKHKPDLILLDIMMPHVGGTEVRAALIHDADTRDIPVIYLTGLKAPVRKATENARHSQVRRISKSEDLSELLKAIQETLVSAPAR